MSQSAKARAQAVGALEDHVTVLKRLERNVKEAIRSARHTQTMVLGIQITTNPEGKVDGDHDRAPLQAGQEHQ